MNLIIGNTSQLSFYFPEDYQRISSRGIDFSKYTDKFYDSVYICFAEQRTFLEKDNWHLFYDINVKYTLQVVDFFQKISKRIVVYGTYDLWNRVSGPIKVTDEFNHNISDYNLSKRVLVEELKRRHYDNLVILYPFNFNSTHRKSGFLFYKIFDSIINEKKIEIGDTYVYRDMVHPKFVVQQSILANKDEIIGSGRLIFVNDFIRNLYKHFHLNYDDLVLELPIYNLHIEREIAYLDSKECLYDKLLEDTIEDIEKIKKLND